MKSVVRPLSFISKEKALRRFSKSFTAVGVGLASGWADFENRACEGSKIKVGHPNMSGEKPRNDWSKKYWRFARSWNPTRLAVRHLRVSELRSSNGNSSNERWLRFPPFRLLLASWQNTAAPKRVRSPNLKAESPIPRFGPNRSVIFTKPIWSVPGTFEGLRGSPVFTPFIPWMWPGMLWPPLSFGINKPSRSALTWSRPGNAWASRIPPTWTTRWQPPQEVVTLTVFPRLSDCTCCWGSRWSLSQQENQVEMPVWRALIISGKSECFAAIAVLPWLPFDAWINVFLAITIIANPTEDSRKLTTEPASQESFGIGNGERLGTCRKVFASSATEIHEAISIFRWHEGESRGSERWMGADISRSMATPISFDVRLRASMSSPLFLPIGKTWSLSSKGEGLSPINSPSRNPGSLPWFLFQRKSVSNKCAILNNMRGDDKVHDVMRFLSIKI